MTIKDECTERKLNNFGLKHMTYINQIFGDRTIRQLIQEAYPNKYLQLRTEVADDRFEEGHHHYVFDKAKNRKICSVDTRGYQYQNIKKNKRDTLCQSYSLLFYFDKKIPKTHKGRQMEMVKLYRDLLKNRAFVELIDHEILSNKANKRLWTDFTKTRGETGTEKSGKPGKADKHTDYVNMDKSVLLRHIHEVLDRWEKYGYRYFTGDGTSC